ncbi:uncharacterized protein FPOAC1_013275 [Fusarium poae]|uniref:uncharacterized protein n=1 Tax=Fusarium poae TaxID=36050 RepID=UPI001D04EC5C|nr:uncharacterized protein FPOAC1_013275 [Fusarium poae]KAG8665296.1 hypothetical protein FPOAC1_013275 [Fusarium poae]
MTSVQNNVKVESPVEDLPMGDTQEAGNRVNEQSESPSSQADDNSSGQTSGTPPGQNDGTPPGQNDGTPSGQTSGTPPGQNGGTFFGLNGDDSSGQNGGTSSGQNGNNSFGQNGGTSSDENHFILDGPTKRGVKIPGDTNAAREYRSFSPGVAEPNSKKQKSNNNDMTNFFGTSTKQSPQGQQTPQSSPPPPDEDDEYNEIMGDLAGNRKPPANMQTIALVRGGRRPKYINMYTVGDRYIYRIEGMKSDDFNAAQAPCLSDEKYRASQNPESWQHLETVLGVAAPGKEMNHSDFLSRLDPENPYKFKWRQPIFIIGRRRGGEITFVNRGWWRANYDPKDPSDRETYQARRPEGYHYYYKTKDDPVRRDRENKNAFQDYRLFKMAFWYERKYYQALRPGQPFVVEDRKKSPSPVDDDVARFREVTIPPDEYQSSKVVQSMESPLADPDVESGTPPQHTSARNPSHTTPQWVKPNGPPRPGSILMARTVDPSPLPQIRDPELQAVAVLLSPSLAESNIAHSPISIKAHQPSALASSADDEYANDNAAGEDQNFFQTLKLLKRY